MDIPFEKAYDLLKKCTGIMFEKDTKDVLIPEVKSELHYPEDIFLHLVCTDNGDWCGELDFKVEDNKRVGVEKNSMILRDDGGNLRKMKLLFCNDAKKTNNKKGTQMDKMIKGAIHDAVVEALKAKPVIVHLDKDSYEQNFVEIKGEIYSMEAAVQKILGNYSWYSEK